MFSLLLFYISSYLFTCREALVEDESGSLRSSIVDIVNRAKRRHLLDRATNIRLGMVSFCLIDSYYYTTFLKLEAGDSGLTYMCCS